MDLMDYRRKIIANSPHLMSASGAVVSFSDGADLPLKSLSVDIEPVQSGSGDPSPSNIRPISGWNAVKVTRNGKNLLDDVSPSVINAYISNQNGVPILRASAENRTVIVQIKENTTYTYTWNQSAIAGASADDSNIILFDEYPEAGVTLGYSTGSNLDGTNNKRTFNSGDYKYAAIKIANIYRSNYAQTLSASMLEVGSTATPYEPYNGVSVSINLGRTVYGGTLNPLTGVLTVDRLGVPMQSLTWYRSTSYDNPIFYTTITGKAYDYRKSACSILRNIGSSTIIAARGFANQSADGDFASSNGNAQIYVRLDSATTIQEFITAVTGQTIIYPLATPVTYQLTPHQIRTLYGNNTIFADTGNVALEYWAHP